MGYNLLINGTYWTYNPLILILYFLGHPSSFLRDIVIILLQSKSTCDNLQMIPFQPVFPTCILLIAWFGKHSILKKCHPADGGQSCISFQLISVDVVSVSHSRHMSKPKRSEKISPTFPIECGHL